MTRADLVPTAAVPLAGFIGEITQPFVAINSRCFGTALTLANESTQVTILAADLLLIDERLAMAIVARTGLPRDQIYFTATHTHGGPGGWGLHPLERLVAGSYQPALFDWLADRLATVVLESRKHLEPAELAFVQTEAPGLQRNRIQPDGPTNDTLSAWIIRSVGPGTSKSPGPALATIVSFGAHATIGHPVPPRLGGDYPAALAATLPTRVDCGLVLFAAGTVGDASPVRLPARNQQGSVEAYAEALAARLVSVWPSARFAAAVPLQSFYEDVALPTPQLPFATAWLRFSPWATWWVGRPRTHLHALRVGPAVLVGFPGDYAGQLGRTLHGGLPVVATSFNGDYKGYLVDEETFRTQPCYETRAMSFFGPHLGPYLNDRAQRAIDALSIP